MSKQPLVMNDLISPTNALPFSWKMLRVSSKTKLLDLREKFLDIVGDKFEPLTFQLSNVGELETLMPVVLW